MVVVLRLDDCDREIRLKEQQVIGTLAFAPGHEFVANDDFAVGELELTAPHRLVPARRLKGRRDKAVADVRFGECLVIHSIDSLVGVVGESLAISPRTAFRDLLGFFQTTYRSRNHPTPALANYDDEELSYFTWRIA